MTRTLIIAMLSLLIGCAVRNVQKDCKDPSDCAPFHHSGGVIPAPNIARPLEKGQFIRVYPSARPY